MALLLVHSGPGEPEWVRKLRDQLRELEALDRKMAAQEKEAEKSGSLLKLNTALEARKRIRIDKQHRMALIGLYERNK